MSIHSFQNQGTFQPGEATPCTETVGTLWEPTVGFQRTIEQWGQQGFQSRPQTSKTDTSSLRPLTASGASRLAQAHQSRFLSALLG